MTWQQALNALTKNRTLLIGIGNTLRMDDAIGVVISETLTIELAGSKFQQNLLIYTAGSLLEDCLSVVIDEKPTVVLIVDACNCGVDPGEIRLLPCKSFPERSLSTHAVPLKAVGNMIEKLAGSKVYYLGIQVADTGFGEQISAPVLAAGNAVIHYVKSLYL